MADDLARHLAATVEQVERRRALGDRLAELSPTDHCAVFRRRASAQGAAEELKQLGYVVRLERRRLITVLLEASKIVSVDPATAESFTREVFDVVAKHGGTCDGWGGPVQR